MMGGTLHVESEFGKGSHFHFTIRVAPASESRDEPPRAPIASIHNLPVLAVDDNDTNRRILGQFLAGAGMRPQLSGSGAEALGILKQAADRGEPFPLFIADARMPRMDGFTLVDQMKQDPQLSAVPVIILTSGGDRGDAVRCRELGVSAYLTKPVHEADLLETIQRVLGQHVENAVKPVLITRHTLLESQKTLRILVVDDNAVNCTLATRLIEKHGHIAASAATGRAALQALEEQTFDLVLMDIQMPDMDGFEATTAIRQRERATGKHLPIIAMTAHAMESDRQRCLSAGMDGYVTKPISVQALMAAIESAVPPNHSPIATTLPGV